MQKLITTSVGASSFGFEPDCGFLTELVLSDQGHSLSPLHTAPWTAEDLPPDAPPHQARLRGDFLAAPFGAGPEGLHGRAANGHWQVAHSAAGTLRAVLDQPLMGATVIKELSLQEGHPFLYQRHVFIGGSGSLPLANHAMISLAGGGKLSFSRKRWFETLAAPLEPDPAFGRSLLAYPARSEDATAFPSAAGEPINLQRYPWGEAHEDFVAAIEEPGATLGWTAVVRPDQGDLFLSLRNPKQLPMTMLWHSNGGRDYAPWNSRHRACLGIEEGAALPVLGLSSQETPDPLSAAGQNGLITLDPYGTCDFRHILGALHWPSGQAVAAVMLEGDELCVTGDWGAERRVPIRGSWLAGASARAAAASKPKPSLTALWDD